MKLGKREIDVLTCPEGRKDRLVFDDELPGFALRVTRDGTKTFIFQYRRGAAVRRLRLGRYGEITPAQARRLAEEARGRVAAGGDPAGERAAVLAAEAETAKARRRQAEGDAFTFARLIDRWEAEWLARRCRPGYRREATRALRVNLANLAGLPAAQIDTATVRRAIDALIRPVTVPAGTAETAKARGKEASAAPEIRGETNARRVRSYGAAMYGWAIKEELLTFNPFAAVRRRGRDAARDRSAVLRACLTIP